LLVLDTDHFSDWQRDSNAGKRLRVRLESTKSQIAVSIVTVEEQMRGWLAEIGRHHDVHQQISAYAKLQRQVEIFAEWLIVPWDRDSADLFVSLRAQGVRIGTLDLKIACMVRTRDAILLTRNTLDFAKVPGLKFENWLE
jgi:tRNA(fMet)-specific endonuclease VapC